MTMYQPLGNIYDSQRLGSFEIHGVSNTFGNQFGAFGGAKENLEIEISQLNSDTSLANTRIAQGQGYAVESWKHPANAGLPAQAVLPQSQSLLGQKSQQMAQLSPTQQDSGASAGDVLTGIAAILSPLATAGVGIFSASQEAQLAKQRLKSGGGSLDPALAALLAQQNRGGNNTGIIIAVVLVFIVMAGMMMYMKNNK